MDSDDDFMSAQSSEEEPLGLEQDSDDGSLGDGRCSVCNPVDVKFANYCQTSMKESQTSTSHKKT